MVDHAFNPGTQEGERQTDLCDFEASKFHDSQGYVERHDIKRVVYVYVWRDWYTVDKTDVAAHTYNTCT